MGSKNMPAEATVAKVAEQLGAAPRWTSQIGPDARLSMSTTRRCLAVLAERGLAAKTDDGQWVAVAVVEDLDDSAKASKATSGMIEGDEDAVAVDTEAEVTAAAVENGDYDVNAASAEWRALKAWKKAGSKGDRPSTANLDAMNAAHADGRPKPNGRKPKREGTRRSKRSARGQQAIAEQRRLGNHRGKGRKVTDEELTDYIRRVRFEHPESSSNDEHMFAYWVEGIANGWGRWQRLWSALDSEFVSKAS